MSVTAQSARIEGGYTADSPAPYMDTVNVAGGFAAAVSFYPQWHTVVLLRRPGGGLVLASLPSEAWVNDCRDAGYEVLPVDFAALLAGTTAPADGAGEVQP